MNRETVVLIQEINAFLKRHRMAPATFGRKAVNSSSLVFSLRNGTLSPTLASVSRLREWMKRQDRKLEKNGN